MSNVDPAYEFDCPRYRDFDQAEDEHADTWFSTGGKVSDVLDEDAEFVEEPLNEESSSNNNKEEAEQTTTNIELTENHTSTINNETEEHTTTYTSTLTMPIAGLQLAAAAEAEKQETIAEEEAEAEAEVVVPTESESIVAGVVADAVDSVESAAVAESVADEAVALTEEEVLAQAAEVIADEDEEIVTANAKTAEVEPESAPIEEAETAVESSEAPVAVAAIVEVAEVAPEVKEAATDDQAAPSDSMTGEDSIVTVVELESAKSAAATADAASDADAGVDTIVAHELSGLESNNISIHQPSSLNISSISDIPLEPTDDISFTHVDEEGEAPTNEEDAGRRGSMVFGMLSAKKRSSLPSFQFETSHTIPNIDSAIVAESVVAESVVASVESPSSAAPSASEAAINANNTSAEVAAEAAVTDIEVEALEQSFLQAPSDEPLEQQQQQQQQENVVESTIEPAAEKEVAEPAPIDAPIEEEAASEPQSMLDQFAAVADDSTPASAIEEDPAIEFATFAEPLPTSSMVLPTTPSRKLRDIGSAGFLRPTAAAIARQVVPLSKQFGLAQHLPSSSSSTTSSAFGSSFTPSTASSAASSAASSRRPSASSSTNNLLPTPSARKRVRATSLEELARPKTVVSSNKLPSSMDAPTFSSFVTPSPSPIAPGSARKVPAPSKLTVAHSPALSTKLRAKPSNLMSSEQVELLKIDTERAEVTKMKKSHQRFFQTHGNMDAEIASMPLRAGNLTQPEEFELHTAKRAKLNAPSQQATPSTPVHEKTLPPNVNAQGELTITKPAPFTFHTSTRQRIGPKILSLEEIEKETMANMPKFKALPLKKEIFTSGGEMGVPRVAKAKPTEATSPQLATKERGEKRKQEEEDATAALKSSAKKIRPAAGAPHLATAERGRKAEEELQRARAEAEPHRPSTAAILSIARGPNGLTAPHTPKVMDHHRAARARLENEHAALIEQERLGHLFQARPLPIFEKVMEVKKSDRPLTTPNEIHLASERRASARAAWDEEQAAVAAESDALSTQRKLELEQEAAAEVARYRKTLVLRAQPMPNMSVPTFVPKLSQTKLTQPESPMLLTKRRAITNGNNDVVKNTLEKIVETNHEIPLQGAENQPMV